MASLSSPESRIKAAVQPGIKNQARCAGRNQESRISRGGQLQYLCVVRLRYGYSLWETQAFSKKVLGRIGNLCV